ncbi:tetratricopeptide repeat-containing sulfotransferase family protein [Kangiella sp. HZ709]|uniref:tetratricopeptide repeat-containing sulfotransferase family protein n=1 Tax=Kangiella sp. HZ709 TaxID=2666328 RepID=UPI0012AF2F3D|nr:tetratricopeptide repeat-containing sulfotransferase family protein [Kangiella sp. HZ709]MRX28264.1 hypothetical protein [Kangiella sp. HZ709]
MDINLQLRINQGIELANKKDYGAAIKIFKDCAKVGYDSWVQLNLANCLIKTFDDFEAARVLTEIINTEDRNTDILLKASHLAQVIYRFDLSLKACSKAYDIKPHSADIIAQLILMKNEARDSSRVEVLCKEMIGLVPNSGWPYNQIGIYYNSVGSFDKAFDAYSKAIELEPNLSFAIAGIVKSKKFDQMPLELIKTIDTALSQLKTPEEKARVLFAKSKIFNDLGMYEDAWTSANSANQLKARLSPFSKENHNNYVQQLIDYNKPESLSKSDNNSAPIWIVGMPRSGTTLIEQVLSGITDLYPGGETPAIDYALYSQFHGGSYLTAPLERKQLNSMATQYDSFFKRFANFQGNRVIDKVPFNFYHIGLFKQLFPQGKVINFSRNRYDIATSIFFENFSLMQNYTHSISDILSVYEGYTKLMDYWTNLYPESVLTIEYSDFVSNNAECIDKIYEFLNLEINHRVDHKLSQNHIETPSIWQARQSLYKTSIERWKRYPQMVDIVNSL